VSNASKALAASGAPQSRNGGQSCPHCGCDVGPAGKSVRSVPQLRRYFAMIKAAFHHWPETADRQFASADELRAYLQMKAGHREIGATIPLTGMNKDRAVFLAEAAIRAAGSYALPILHGDTLVIFKPKSIAFSKLSHTEFCRLSDDVSDVIFNETGQRGEQLLMETEAAA
jgi:hypothetical protein